MHSIGTTKTKLLRIIADESLPQLHEFFGNFFEIHHYDSKEKLLELLPKSQILLCRSTLKLDKAFLQKHQKLLKNLKYIATASSGIDHIDYNFLSGLGIKLLDAKGANAAAVADYVMASLAFLLQKNPKRILRRAGIIGLGAVGSQVAARLAALGLELFCYDPPLEQRDREFKSCSLDNLFSCDLICIHANLHQLEPNPSFNLINLDFLKQLKKETFLINAARGKIVVEEDLVQILAGTGSKTTPELFYCTDVYANEPNISPELLQVASLCTPHIAGHSIEAKTRILKVISQKIHQEYQLEAPLQVELQEPTPSSQSILAFYQQPEWIKRTLEFYNPEFESLQLKQGLKTGLNLADNFLSCRRAHRRHEFF